jgi:predicted secreted protein
MRELSHQDSDATIIVAPAEQIRISLPEMPSTGARWEIAADTTAEVHLENDEYDHTRLARGMVVGGKGTRRLTFEVLGSGVLHLRKVRHWLPDNPYADYRIVLEIEGDGTKRRENP